MRTVCVTFWERNHRIRLLSEFRNYVCSYFRNTHISYDDYIEDDNARKARTEINRLLFEVKRFVGDAFVPHKVVYYPAPIQGGSAREIDLLTDIFQLHRSNIEPQQVLDTLERAIGLYQADYRNAILRTFNPLFWIGKGLRAISSLPFTILEHSGLYGRKFEDSLLGRIIKLLTQIVALLTAIHGFMKLIGKEDWITLVFG